MPILASWEVVALCFVALLELVPAVTAFELTEPVRSLSQNSKVYSAQSPSNTSSWYQGHLHEFFVNLHAVIRSNSLTYLVLRLAAFVPLLSSNLLQFSIAAFTTLFSSSSSIDNFTIVFEDWKKEGGSSSPLKRNTV